MDGRWIATGLLGLALAGCGQATEARIEVDPEVVARVQDGQALVKASTDEESLREIALASLHGCLARTLGDEKAKQVGITIDEGPPRTFGPERWRVGGTLDWTYAAKPTVTRWAVDLEWIDGRVQSTCCDRDARE